jgi:hypothetical protein
MKRRKAIQLATLSLGAFFSSELAVLAQGQSPLTGASLATTSDQEMILAELADLIIPNTETPGAKAAGVEKFIVRVLRDCHNPQEQKQFYNSLANLEAEGVQTFGLPFLQLNAKQRTELLTRCTVRDKPFFLKLKQLTVTGYFTSEIGASKALAYLPIPGNFIGSVPMEPGQKTWAL